MTGSASSPNTPEALHGELRATLGRAPAPRLSRGFEARLEARIRTTEAIPERRCPRPELGQLLPLYWLLVAGAVHWILSDIEWAAVPRPGIWYVATAALSLLLPSVLLAWQARLAWR